MEGVSTRRVDDLIKALGCDGISSSQVSRICEQLDEVVESFLGRPLDGGPYPYVWLDGLTQKVREGGRIVNVCVVVATGVNADGQREILGMGRGRQRGRRVLAGLPAVVDGSRAQRGGTGNLRCSPGAEERHRRGVRWSPAGNAAAPTSWPTCSPECPSVPNLEWPPWYAPSTSNCLPPRSTAN